MTSEEQGRRIVRERAGGKCEAAIPGVCTGRHDSTHHRVKRSQGGTWDPSNLLGVCGDGTRGCHGWIEANPSLANAEGLGLLRGDDPREVVVHMRWENARSWWRLDDEGLLYWDGTDFEPLELASDHALQFAGWSSFRA